MTTVVLHIKTTRVEYLITASSLYSLCKCWVPVKITCIIPSHKEDYFYWFVLKNILLKLTSDSYYSSYYFLLLTSVPPTLTLSGSESKSNIKLECTAPTQALQDTQWMQNRESGKKGRRRRRLSTSNQWDYWERQREDVELWALWPLSRTDLFWFNY